MRRLVTAWLAAGAMLCALMMSQPASAQVAGFDSSSLNGNFAFQLNKFGWCYNIETSVGLFNFTPGTGSTGKVNATFTNYYSNKAGNGPKVKTGSASGTYTVNSNGTGEIDFTTPNHRTFPFVIDGTTSTGTERIEVINASLHSPRCAMSGYAIQQ